MYEAISTLDTKFKLVVQDALDKVMVNRTRVLPHQLTTIKGVDVIAMVNNGVIVEKRSHDVLMRINGGDYTSLAALHKSAA